MRRALLSVSLLTAALAAVPATASAVTFGADLSRAPNSTTRCSEILAAPTCSLNSTNLSTGESAFPPSGEGVVTAVRVRVGPVTGPMQVAVEQALRQDNPFEPGKPNYACCKLVALSQVFTPAANSVTTVPVNFPVKQSTEPDENGYYIDDHLSLSVLDPNVPIPANYDPSNGSTLAGGWFPAWQAVGEQRAGQAGIGSGLTILFNAEWSPAPGAAPGGTPAPVLDPTLPPARALTLPRVARVRGNRALLPLLCGLDTVCRGVLRLQNRRAAGAAGASAAGRRGKRRVVTFARTGFRIPAGKRRTVRAVLGRAGQRLLRRRGKLRLWANVSIRGGQRVAPVRVTLKRAPARKKKGARRGKRAAR